MQNFKLSTSDPKFFWVSSNTGDIAVGWTAGRAPGLQKLSGEVYRHGYLSEARENGFQCGEVGATATA